MVFNRINGFSAFLVIWVGQLFSIVGAGITSFALGLWVYEQTKSVTYFSFILLFTLLPDLILSPFVGPFVDRWSKKNILICSDAAGFFIMLVLLIIVLLGYLQFWFIYVAVSLHAIFKSFQWIAYYSSISLLVPKKYIGNASGMISTTDAAAKLLGPLLGALFYIQFGLIVTITITVITYLIGIFSVSFVNIPKINNLNIKRSVLQDLQFGWEYIYSRPGLLYLLFLLFFTNLSFAMNEVLMTPYILMSHSQAIAAKIMSVAGIGMLAGGIVFSIWGGPKNKINSIIVFLFLESICMVIQGLTSNIYLTAIAFCILFFISPLIGGSNQIIWQVKVASQVQGKVFAIRGSIAWASLPIAYLIAGPLADHVFEPLLTNNNILSAYVGQYIGIGPGRGIAFLIIISGLFMFLSASMGLMCPRLLNLENELQDHMNEKLAPNVHKTKMASHKVIIENKQI